MKISYKKLGKALTMAFAFIIFSGIAYATSWTTFLERGLLDINNFLSSQQYTPYAKAIDFIFFSLLFIAVYLRGVRHAFKEVKRPEQFLAILLGFMTAFLLVLADISVAILLPYIHWILYVLLLAMYWWLFKWVKSSLWRFAVALLLTLLTIILIQGMFSTLTAQARAEGTSAADLFKSVGSSFGAIEMPGVSAPGVPDYMKDLFGVPTATAPSQEEIISTTRILPEAQPMQAAGQGIFDRHWWIAPLIVIAILASGTAGIRYRKKIKGWIGKGEKEEEPAPPNIPNIIAEIGKTIKNKEDSIKKINESKENKDKNLTSADKKIVYLENLASLDLAYLFTEEGRKYIEKGESAFKEIITQELDLIEELKNLAKIESDFCDKLNNWGAVIQKERGAGIQKIAGFLNELIRGGGSHGIRKTGISRLIALCYNFEKEEYILSKELKELLNEREIEMLVKGKFESVKNDKAKLTAYSEKEKEFIGLLAKGITYQIKVLKLLKKLLSGDAKQKTEKKGEAAIPTEGSAPETAPAPQNQQQPSHVAEEPPAKVPKQLPAPT